MNIFLGGHFKNTQWLSSSSSSNSSSSSSNFYNNSKILNLNLDCIGSQRWAILGTRFTRSISWCWWLAMQMCSWRLAIHYGDVIMGAIASHDCVLNRLLRRRSNQTSKLRVTGLCVGNSSGTGEFPAQMASNAENASIWWRHHDILDHRLSHRLGFCNMYEYKMLYYS